MNRKQPRPGQAAREAAAPKAAPKALVVLTLAAPLVLGLLLSVQNLQTPDLGYHLAYGLEFWDHGRLVDYNPFLYTLPALDAPADQRPQPSPGSWYDSQGRYRFPNANWLTQVAVAGVYKLGGAIGLCLLRSALIAAVLAICLLTIRNLRVPWPWASAGLLLIALCSYERFWMRPELFSFVLLAGQLCLLMGKDAPAAGPPTGQAPRREGVLRWPAVAGVIFLQLLLVNVHSYFLLGLALTGAILCDRLLVLWWRRLTARSATPGEEPPRASACRLGAALGGQFLVCWVNPWTWRLVLLPLQTLRYLKEHRVTEGAPYGGMPSHPWAFIGECYSMLTQIASLQTRTDYAFCALLALAAAAVAAAAMALRWDRLLLVLGTTAVAMSMRRNIAVGAILATPVALAAIQPLAGRLAHKLSPAGARNVSVAAAAALILACAAISHAVVTQRFYFDERSPIRFATGFNRLQLPLGVGRWFDRHHPVGRMWADFASSSNVYFFTGRRNDINVLTNTWACPPDVMWETLNCGQGEVPFRSLASKYSLEIAVLRVDAAPPIIKELAAANSGWTPVCVDGASVVFLRAAGPNKELAAACALSAQRAEADVEAYASELVRYDPLPMQGLNAGAMTFFQLGWYSPAIRLLEESVGRYHDRYGQTWDLLGLSHLERARSKAQAGDKSCLADWDQAAKCFTRAMELGLQDSIAEDHLQTVSRDLQLYRRRTAGQ